MNTQAAATICAPDMVSPLPELCPCELRRSRQGAAGEELICGAGGFVLGTRGRDDAAIVVICSACPIPAALAQPEACLQLRPIRLEEHGEWRSFFNCRWFYTLRPERQIESREALCAGCPYWFPRPGIALMRGYWAETDRIRQTVQQARNGPPPAQTTWARISVDRKRGWWSRLRELICGWV
jgi:hypothetical protein